MTNPVQDTGILGLAKRLFSSKSAAPSSGRSPNSVTEFSEFSGFITDPLGNPIPSASGVEQRVAPVVSGVGTVSETVPPNANELPGFVTDQLGNPITPYFGGAGKQEPSPAAAATGTPVRLQNINIEKSKFDPERALTNPLDGYINVTYNFSLGLVRESKVKELQQIAPSGTNLDALLGENDVVVFASTGDTKTNSPDFMNYLTIRSVEFTNLMAATVQNPMLTPMYDIRMSLFEPHGFRFNEHIRALGRELGWGTRQPGRFVYRLQLWFSGYDPTTGQWVQKIPVAQIDHSEISTFTVFVSIPTIEANITGAGSEYSVSCVPVAQFVFRSQDYTLEGCTLTTGPSRSFGGLLSSLAQQLEKQKAERTGNRIKNEYEFICPQYLADAVYSVSDRSSFLMKRNAQPEGELYHQVGDSIGIMMFLRKALDHLEVVQRQTVQGQSNTNFLNPTVRPSIRVNTIFMEASDDIGDYTKVRFQYIIEPHVSFYRGDFRLDGRNDLVNLENQIKRADRMISLGMLQKVYDFYFSGGNSEVLKFDIRFNRFFGEALDPVADSVQSRNLNTKETPNQTAKSFASEDNGFKLTISGENDPDREAPQARVSRLIGAPSQVRAATETLTPTDIIGSHSEIHPRQISQNTSNSEAEILFREYQQASDLFTRHEMLKAEVEVRGDPIWMFNPYMSGGDFAPVVSGGAFSTKGSTTAKVKANTDRCIFLRAYSPAQADYMNPLRQYGSSEPTLIGGFYLVIKAHSRFEGGKYTQRLECNKLVHMNYVVDALKRFNATSAGSASSTDQTATNDDLNNPRTITG